MRFAIEAENWAETAKEWAPACRPDAGDRSRENLANGSAGSFSRRRCVM